MYSLTTLCLAWTLATADAQATALIRQLDDPRFEVRQQADEALRQAGLHIVPRLQAELANGPSLELRQRLQAIIHHYIRPHWHTFVEEGVAEAKRTGKPLLVFVTPVTGVGADQMAPPAIDDHRLAQFLKQRYVVAWQVDYLGYWLRASNPAANSRREQTGPISYLCSPDGVVLQHLAGLPGLEQLAEEDGAARVLTAAPVERPANGQAQETRPVQVAKIPRVALNRNAPANPVGRPIVDVLGLSEAWLSGR